jgi:cytochrome c oxidase cbb3-type subunit IV
MYSDILRNIAGVEIFPLVSLVLFVAVFVVMLIKVARANPSELERLAALPLDRDSPPAALLQTHPARGDVR